MEGRGGPRTAETMTTNTTDDTGAGVVDDEADRYAELNIGDEEFVIYDRENYQAWLQSSVTVDLDTRR
ncbi:hypothetical protein BRC87_08635 [Halobacteriales archaeon QS_4_66_20]|nr:MAG: hypothetical protein BRC87_08635 [Halobacteriales archaeon QS_4_66_20]